MKVCRLSVFLGAFLAFWIGFAGAQALAAATDDFKITATGVTMPSSGNGSSQYVVTGIPVTGNLILNCQYAGDSTGLKIPYCGGGPIVEIPVKAGETVKGTIYFYPYSEVVPVSLHRTGRAPVAGLALAGVLLLSLGFRRNARRWFALTLMAVGTLAGLAGISACTGSFNGMTPGKYQYTITAENGNPLTNLLLGTNTTITVTVP